MKVKKFEARSMKEALDLVKTQLGPDAVILSAKETRKAFGIGGEKSIEITAAFSENILNNKKFVESRLPDSKKEIFANSTIKKQKEIMQKVIESQLRRSHPQSLAHLSAATQDKMARPIQPSKPRFANLKYVDIPDEMIEDEAGSYAQASQPVAVQKEAPLLTQQAQQIWNNMEVQGIKNEIFELKELLQDKNKNSQSNFLNSYPGQNFGVHYEFVSLFESLTAKGINPELVGKIMTDIQNYSTAGRSQKEVLALVGRSLLGLMTIDSSTEEKFHVFVGPSGSGKTSTMIKLASLLASNNKSVALVSTDTLKLGAEQEIKLYSQILNLPFISIRHQSDWLKLMPFLESLDHVLIDTSGLSLKNNGEAEYLLEQFPKSATNQKVHLVLSSIMHTQLLNEYLENFSKINFTDLTLSFVDQIFQPGLIFNLNQLCSKPLFSFGIGPRIPEDFEMATAERVVDLILEITKNRDVEISL